MSQCFVTAKDHDKYFRLAVAVTRSHFAPDSKVIGSIAPADQDAPTLCIYCTSAAIDEKQHPYCSAQCAISAQQE